MGTKEAYKHKMKTQLKEWAAQINLLAAKAESAGADARLKYAQDIDKLRAKQHQAAEKLKELETASGEAWKEVKDTADKLWDELKAGIEKTTAKFK